MGQTDARTDIFGLGMTMHHLLTGVNPNEPPYEAKPIRQYDSELPIWLETVVEKCIRPNPEERYQSCQELLYDLEHQLFFSEMKSDQKKQRKVMNKDKIKKNIRWNAIKSSFVCILFIYVSLI